MMPMCCKPCYCHVVSISRETSCPMPQRTGMTLRVCALLAVLIVATRHTEARPSHRGMSLVNPMDPRLADAAFEQPDQRVSREMENLMYEMLQQNAQQQQQQQQQQDDIELDSNPMVPDDFPIVSETLAPADKRGSYMSLCHFKICNMGRKRGQLRKSQQWNRF